MWWALAIGAALLAYALVVRAWARRDLRTLSAELAESSVYLGVAYERIEELEAGMRNALDALPTDEQFRNRMRAKISADD